MWGAEGPGSGAEIGGPPRIWGQAPRGGNCKASLAGVKTPLGSGIRASPAPCSPPTPTPQGRRPRHTAGGCASDAHLKPLLMFKNIFSLLLFSSYTIDSCLRGNT